MNTYLETISKKFNNKTAKKAVIAELQAHIEEKKDYYIEIGYTEEEAQAKAIEEMGDAEETAVSLNGLYSVKWYKIPINIISLILYILIFIYASTVYYDYGNVLLSRNHSIGKDIGSTLILGIFIFILIFAYRRKSKFLALSVPCFLCLLLLFSLISSSLLEITYGNDVPPLLFTIFAQLRNSYIIFAPFFYLLITVFTKGPLYYLNSVLSIEVFDTGVRSAYTFLSVLIFIVIIALGLLIFLFILRKERMKPSKKVAKLIKYLLRLFCVFAAANFIIMSFSMLYSYFTISRDEIFNTRERMINCVVNTKKISSRKSAVKYINSCGFKLTKINENFDDCNVNIGNTYNYFYYNSQLTYAEFELIYSVSLNSFPILINESDLKVPSSVIAKYNNVKLNEFLNDDIYKKAFCVTRITDDSVTFDFITYENTRVSLTFTDDVLVSNTQFGEYGEVIEDTDSIYDETFPPTTKPIVFN